MLGKLNITFEDFLKSFESQTWNKYRFPLIKVIKTQPDDANTKSRTDVFLEN